MILKNTFFSALILSLTALSACTQVPPPKAGAPKAQLQAQAEAMTELAYGKLEIRQDLEGSTAFSIEADQEDSLKLTVYDSCDPSKIILNDALKHGDEKELFEGVMGILSGKVEVKGVDQVTATAEQARSRNLILTEVKGENQVIYVSPTIASYPELIKNLEKFVEDKLAAIKPAVAGGTAEEVKTADESGTVSGADAPASAAASPSPSPSATPAGN